MRCWAEISLDNLKSNINEIEKITPKDKIMAILKANAYGHGVKEIYKVLVKEGLSWFGVATSNEAFELLEIDQNQNILILGPMELNEMQKCAENNIRLTITNFAEIDYLKQEKIKAKIHVKVDTGMGRVGFIPSEIDKAIEEIQNIDTLELEGLFSHLSSSEEEEYSLKQINLFKDIISRYPNIKYKHILNSIGSVNYLDYTYDFIRPGIIIYGGVSKEESNGYNFKPVMSFKTRISFVKKLKEDTYISYKREYLAKKGDTIATIAIGYADGLRRDLSNKGQVYCNGVLCDIIGNVCMDQTMILIPEGVKVNVSDEVEIFGENISCMEIADICGTISYEILCGISPRVKRVYK